MSYKVEYCKSNGRPHTVNFDDGLAMGVHRKGTQVTLPLGVKEWQTLPMPSKLQVIFTDDEQIDRLIERLTKLKSLKAVYNQPINNIDL